GQSTHQSSSPQRGCIRMPLLRRHCPNCGTKVGWVRLWLIPWIWERWPCPGCGAVLKFDLGRRLLVAGLITLEVLLTLVAVMNVDDELWGMPSWCPVLAAFALLAFSTLLLDAVTLA